VSFYPFQLRIAGYTPDLSMSDRYKIPYRWLVYRSGRIDYLVCICSGWVRPAGQSHSTYLPLCDMVGSPLELVNHQDGSTKSSRRKSEGEWKL
jgi:hypothetical protein